LQAMNFEGWASPYKTNRPITEVERKARLEVSEKYSSDLYGKWIAIHVNDVFFETVDKLHPSRGITLLFLGPLLLLWATMGIVFLMDFAQKQISSADATNFSMFAAVAFAMVLTCAFSYLLFRILVSHEIFSHTHYPVRLNRQNRKVYVFRSSKNGGPLTLNWSEVFWQHAECAGKFAGSADYEIRGHVLDPDGVTVRDTFSLGACGPSIVVSQQWELFRRYMEGGPGQVPPQQLLPIANRRESFWFGMRRCASLFDIHPIVMLLTCPFWASVGWARAVAMRTCRVPRWPQDVVDACEGQVSPGKEMRKKDRVLSALGEDWATRVVVVVGTLVGGACGAAFWYWVFTGSGFVRIVGETLGGGR
jgi:hypothetical protein